MNNILWISGGRVIDPANQRDAIGEVYAIDGKLVDTLSDSQKEAEFTESMAQTIPLGRPQTPEDMGDAVLYLITAANVSGVALSVAGGFEMQ